MGVSELRSTCPRCGKPLSRDTEPDFGWCIDHGTVFRGVPLPRTRSTMAEDFYRPRKRRKIVK